MGIMGKLIEWVRNHNPVIAALMGEVIRALASTAGLLAITIVVVLSCLEWIPWWGVFIGGVVCIFLGHGIDKHIARAKDVEWKELVDSFMDLAILVATVDKDKAAEEEKVIADILRREFGWKKSRAERSVKNKLAAVDITHDISEEVIVQKCRPLKEKTRKHRGYRVVMLMLLRQVVIADKICDYFELQCLRTIAKSLDINHALSEALIAHMDERIIEGG